MPRRFSTTSFRAVLVAGGLALAPVPAALASPLTDAFSSVAIFGDSLSDPGNASALLQQLGIDYPQPEYYRDPETGLAQFSDGPVWSTLMTDLFEAEGLAAANYAFGAAQAVQEVSPPPPPLPQIDLVPDLPRQLLTNLVETATGSFVPGAANLSILFFGGNDITSAVSSFTGDDAALRAAARAAARNVGLAGRILAGSGASTVAIVNLPDLGVIPRYNLFGSAAEQEAASLATAAYNRALAREAARLRRLGAAVVEVDLAAQLAGLIADPGQIGVTDVVNPCGVPDGDLLGLQLYDFSNCTPGYLFFDDIHVSAPAQAAIYDFVHDSIAASLAARVTPVPLPLPAALLGLGVVLLAGLGRGRPAA